MWLAIQDFLHHVSNMLAWVADTLMQQGTERDSKGMESGMKAGSS